MAHPSTLRRRITAGTGLVLAATAFLGACGGGQSAGSDTVTVYTGRHYGIEPVFAAFTKATGIEVRFTTGSDPELRERLIAEGENTPADLVMTADAANIELASAAGLLAPFDSAAMQDAIPVELRSAKNDWFALSRRLRVLMYSTTRVTTPPTSYSDLADAEWKGRLCLRPSTHPYTQSLVASLIANLGAADAEALVAGWVKNSPLYVNSDTDILKAIVAGDCDVAITNTYYLARLLAEDSTTPVAVSWPDQSSFGAHLNVSAAAVLAAAPNPEGAQRLLEWLATSGQKIFSDANYEYPADPTVEPAEILVGFGEYRADLAAVRQLGTLNPDAVALLSRVGYE